MRWIAPYGRADVVNVVLWLYFGYSGVLVWHRCYQCYEKSPFLSLSLIKVKHSTQKPRANEKKENKTNPDSLPY